MDKNEEQNFHEFALQSILFKGQPNLYFCYLKSEKLAFAIAKISSLSNNAQDGVLERLLEESALLPGLFTQLAAQRTSLAPVLARIFEALSLVRAAVSKALITEQNGLILCREYELVARKTAEIVPQYLSLQDLIVSEMPSVSLQPSAGLIGHKGQTNIKDNKGQIQSPRKDTILKIITENKRVSIKDISKIVRDCSEKTIQRELLSLIGQGLVRKEGKRRWSTYLTTDSR